MGAKTYKVVEVEQLQKVTINPLLPPLSIMINWHDSNIPPKNKKEERDNLRYVKLLGRSIGNYIERFNSLPPIGFLVSAGRYCPSGEIKWITYDGVDNIVEFYLDWI